MMMRRQIVLLRRAKQIFQTEGLVALLRRGFAFRATYYLYEHSPSERLKGRTEADFMPKIQGLTFEIVSTNQEADELAAEGLEFRSQDGIDRERLDRGAVAFCAFVEKELAHIGWVAMTEEAKKMVDSLPYKVDFADNEVCMGGVWTNPKYRRMGLLAYTDFKEHQFLKERGIVKSRASIVATNIASQRGVAKFGAKMYAEAHYSRVLWWKSWKEKPLA
jgi:RimJ/RimL family protein N-acetyltransferase